MTIVQCLTESLQLRFGPTRIGSMCEQPPWSGRSTSGRAWAWVPSGADDVALRLCCFLLPSHLWFQIRKNSCDPTMQNRRDLPFSFEEGLWVPAAPGNLHQRFHQEFRKDCALHSAAAGGDTSADIFWPWNIWNAGWSLMPTWQYWQWDHIVSHRIACSSILYDFVTFKELLDPWRPISLCVPLTGDGAGGEWWERWPNDHQGRSAWVGHSCCPGSSWGGRRGRMIAAHRPAGWDCPKKAVEPKKWTVSGTKGVMQLCVSTYSKVIDDIYIYSSIDRWIDS